MDREDALIILNKVCGTDLRPLAQQYSVTVFKDGKKNKGWAGHVLEKHLNLRINSSQSPDFGDWELKSISLKYSSANILVLKETMAITMIDPENVVKTEFANSHLLNKLRKTIIAARVWESQDEPRSILYAARIFDLNKPRIFRQVQEDYEIIRYTIKTKGFDSLTGAMGTYIQPRTKGAGHGSTSRAFYARTSFLRDAVFPELAYCMMGGKCQYIRQ